MNSLTPGDLVTINTDYYTKDRVGKFTKEDVDINRDIFEKRGVVLGETRGKVHSTDEGNVVNVHIGLGVFGFDRSDLTKLVAGGSRRRQRKSRRTRKSSRKSRSRSRR
jgi:hypothetical protein